MTNMKSTLTETLQAVATDEDVHVERLLAGARRAGVRYRRRHRMVVLGCTVLSCAMIAGGLAVVRPLWAGRPTTVSVAPANSPAPSATVPSSPAPSAMTAMPSLPLAPAASPALTAPDEVGRNPLLLHVWLATLPFPATNVQALNIGGQESLSIEGPGAADGSAPTFVVQAGRRAADLDPLSGTRHDVTVNGRAAVAAVNSRAVRPFVTVRWQPVTGLWAQVSGAMNQATAVAIAAEVRLDQVRRCAVPFRLPDAPANARISSCNITFADGQVLATVGVQVSGWTVGVGVMPGGVRNANEVLGGRPARVVEHSGDGSGRIMEIRVDRGDHFVDLTAEGAYNAAVVRSLAGGVVLSGGSDPADWPVSPLS